jgi:hypothetical protein
MAKNDNSRYLVFAAFYVGEAQFNATEAAKLAGFKASTRNSLNSQASEALRRPDVQEYIRNHVQKIEIKQEDLLREMYKLAMWDHEKDDPSKREVDEEEEDGATSLKDLLDAPFSMEEAKLYDTKMRAKLKSLSDLLKTFDNDTARELEKVRKAIEEHRRIHGAAGSEYKLDDRKWKLGRNDASKRLSKDESVHRFEFGRGVDRVTARHNNSRDLSLLYTPTTTDRDGHLGESLPGWRGRRRPKGRRALQDVGKEDRRDMRRR